MDVFRRGEFLDVFTGKGYDNYSLFQVEKNIPKLVSGPSITKDEFKELIKLVKEL